MARFTINAVVGSDDVARAVEVTGRPAWLLEKLVEAGSAGLTTAQLPPGIRASHYVMLLRRQGIAIETEHVGHSGPFAGRHGIYRLKTPVQIVRELEAAE